MRALPLLLKAAAACLIVFSACWLRFERSQSKNTMNDGGATCGGGGGAAAAGDQCTAGLNFVPLRPREEVLADHRSVLLAIYRPEAYFARVRQVGRRLRRPRHEVRIEAGAVVPRLRALGRLCRQSLRPGLRWQFWRTVFDVLRHNPAALEFVLILGAFYLHLGPFSRHVVAELERQIREVERQNRAALAGDPSVREVA